MAEKHKPAETKKPETNMLLAVFEDIDPAAHGMDALRGNGINNDHITVISGTPITEGMMGRPKHSSNVPRFALGGAITGFLIGLFFAFGTPALYPVYVGGQPLFPVPPSVVVLFEMTMLIMMISTFLGVFLDSRFPSYSPKEYVPEISDGHIALLFECPVETEKTVVKALKDAGAHSVRPAELQTL